MLGEESKPPRAIASGPTEQLELPFFAVKLDFFDGPIDLLLHLVKQRELPIEKVSLALVADQFSRCVEQSVSDLERLDLEMAAEYLVLATTLLSIKAAVLLHGPQPEMPAIEEGPDPHEELLRKLREAAIYRDGAQALGARDMLGVHVFRTTSTIEQYDRPDENDLRFDAMLLGKAFEKMLARIGKNTEQFEIYVDSVTVMERMVKILDLLNVAKERQAPYVKFHELIGQVAAVQARSQVISAFLAVLELCKRRAIRVTQQSEQEFGEIVISLSGSDSAASLAGLDQLDSEFDRKADDSGAELSKAANLEQKLGSM